MARIDEKALFLGPKSENRKFFSDMMNWMVNDHLDWRKYFHPDDKAMITASEKSKSAYQATLRRISQALIELAKRLHDSSVPWFSPRYLGHMTSDTLMAANLGYMLTLLYNPNNIAFEASPATTGMEFEVGRQLAKMLGYDPARSWGHITSGGTVANYEGLWVARNLKSVPLAVRNVRPSLVDGMNNWQLLNMPPSRTLDLMDRIREENLLETVLRASARGKGVSPGELGKVLVPQSRHYSWSKAADVLGIGQENLICIRVKDNYRMDMEDLRSVLDSLAVQKIPVLAVVGVVGTTEEGAVDEIHRIAEIRTEYEKKGLSFILHIDAAYGGYARSIFLDENDDFMEYDTLRERLNRDGVLSEGTGWPPKDVYDAFKAMPEADSITVDPHKMGYIPYSAGSVLFRDKRVRDLVSYFAAYVFDKTEDNPLLLGSYIMEGSKPGAVVAAVWTAHRVLPLNVTGYGKIMGCSIEGAQRFYKALLAAPLLEMDLDRSYVVYPLTEPDFNIVDFAFNDATNTDLDAMNALNQRIYEKCSYKSGPVYRNDFFVSKTDLSYAEYGDAPASFVSKFDIPASSWEKVKSVYILRSCVLTPYLVSNTTFETYWKKFMSTMWGHLNEVVKKRPEG